MKKVLTLILLIGLIGCAQCLADQQMPEWDYPLEPEILANRTGFITLVNRDSLLDPDYEPLDLQVVNVRCVSAIRGKTLRKAALEAMRQMFDAAEADGFKLYLKSVYRSYQTQKTIYDDRIRKIGRDDGVVAYPGSSDHQTGLGADILNYEWTKKSGMTPAFAETAEAQWMADHCHEYGFIIRYEEDKQELTKIIYEPWHLRYVGKETAAYMKEKHYCLEEFDAEWHSYITQWEANGGDFERLLMERSQPRQPVVLFVTEDGEEEVSLFN